MPEFKPAGTVSLILAVAASLAAALVFYLRPGIFSILFTWCFVIGLAIAVAGRQKPVDLGLSAAGVLPGIASGALYWLMLQGAVVALAPLFGKRAELDPHLATGAWLAFAGPLLDQLIFFASSEEIVHRGFLMPQIYVRLRARLKSYVALAGAVLLGSVFFALLHTPHRLLEGVSGRELAFQLWLLALAGVFFCAVYLMTGNLLCAIFIHALSNFPTLPLDAGLPWPAMLMIKYALGLLLAGSYAVWRRRTRAVTARSAVLGRAL